ncbi:MULTISPECIES: hypothetical protein [Cyanophyceae]|uniref:hypothetical protein n=1 Tax=Cyanophyceae TaxID=3028117 RepID=UPI0016849A5D|nr:MULTISPECIES: hypothetical protein [Cyanophyceae]MBD1917163.1 hypothetical protein [Phormidium sp. FACHB-77]MBD2030694.1 hypothetical protein [Phormidium sp. FACHB-322]MBD2050198.1 hypothetical protein [Leptolyngbya sp. FACHB-60]
MTVVNLGTQVPLSVNSLAKTLAWAGGAYYSLYRFLPYQESENSANVPVVTMQDGLAANKTERVIIRVSLEMTPDWRTSDQPFWVNVVEPSAVALPPAYLRV